MTLDFANTYTQILDSDARTIARQVARGSYQRALLEDAQALARLSDAGLHVLYFPGPRGKICVAIALPARPPRGRPGMERRHPPRIRLVLLGPLRR